MNKTLLALISASMLLFSLSAWSASTKEEILELRIQVTEIQRDLAEIKKLLAQGARAPAAKAVGFRKQTIKIGDSPFKGKVDAPVTLVEYSDYQCPFCARNYRNVMPILQEEYIDTGKLRFVMREYPLATIHKNATNASIAALCAGGQGKYWEMHDLLFDNQKELGVDNLKSFAGTIGLDTASFNECLDSKKSAERVRKDMAGASKLGMGGTPGFFIGLTDQSEPDNVELSVYLKGAKPIDEFRASIDDLLKSVE
jgi:protein-disulfide isomerase